MASSTAYLLELLRRAQERSRMALDADASKGDQRGAVRLIAKALRAFVDEGDLQASLMRMSVGVAASSSPDRALWMLDGIDKLLSDQHAALLVMAGYKSPPPPPA